MADVAYIESLVKRAENAAVRSEQAAGIRTMNESLAAEANISAAVPSGDPLPAGATSFVPTPAKA